MIRKWFFLFNCVFFWNLVDISSENAKIHEAYEFSNDIYKMIEHEKIEPEILLLKKNCLKRSLLMLKKVIGARDISLLIIAWGFVCLFVCFCFFFGFMFQLRSEKGHVKTVIKIWRKGHLYHIFFRWQCFGVSSRYCWFCWYN